MTTQASLGSFSCAASAYIGKWQLFCFAAGVELSSAITATCLGGGIMTGLMGLFSNRPLACASGMGVNAVVAFSLTQYWWRDWHASMAVIFREGIFFILLLVLAAFIEAIMDAIPVKLRHTISNLAWVFLLP